MRISSIVMALLALHTNATAADVIVYITSQSASSTYAAKKIAESVFHKAGLSIAWATGTPPGAAVPGIRLHITLAEQTPDDRLPGALAIAYPFATCSKSITVFSDRIRSVARRPERESALLAYVLVHEITHVLQRVDRHSDDGLMKASWGTEERAEIFARRLPLTDEDVRLIRHGMALGCRRELTAQSGSGSAARPE